MEQPLNIKTMTVAELESLAYRQLVAIENAQKNLQVINQEIVSRSKPVEEPKPEPNDTQTIQD